MLVWDTYSNYCLGSVTTFTEKRKKFAINIHKFNMEPRGLKFNFWLWDEKNSNGTTMGSKAKDEAGGKQKMGIWSNDFL